MPGKITLLVGTTKGAFLIEGAAASGDWTVSGPHCGGWLINHAVGDSATGTIWAGGGLAVARRRPELAGAEDRPAAAGLLLHRAAPGDGG